MTALCPRPGIATAFGLAMAIGSRSATPACGEDKHDHPAQQQRGQNHGYQLPPSHEELRGDSHGDQRYDHRGGYGYNDQHYGYIYAPPPVAYMPQPSPGITLVFPLQFR